MDKKIGKIITFYSYKGGTGRSMALANIAWILASNGKKVLVIDWDLEAPGLHRYYSPFLLDTDLQATDGLIDFLFEYVNASLTKLEGKNEDWHLPYTDLSRYTTSLINTNFISNGTLDFVPAGRQDTNYAYKVNTFDWMVFYEKLKGGAFLDIVKGQIKEEYDYILIDSRTGVSDTSGICTIQIPDLLVACFTYNVQSIDGVSAVLNSIVKQRQDNRLSIFPVPTRVELGEKDRLDRARVYAQHMLNDFLRVVDKEKYWSEIEVLYQPYYAYEEILATFGDRISQSNSILSAMERITDFITIGDVKGSIPPTEDERKSALDVYLKKYELSPATPIEPKTEKQLFYQREEQPRKDKQLTPSSNSLFFISYATSDALDFTRKLADNLEGGYPHIETWLDKRDLRPGDDWDDQVAEAIRNCKAILFIVTRDSVADGSICKEEWSLALKYKKPVILLRLHKEAEIPFRLSNRQYIDFNTNFTKGLAILRQHIAWLDSPEGQLGTLKDRLTDAQRDLRRARSEDQPRVQAEIDELKKQIESQEKIVANPKAAEAQTQKNIEAGLERERQPEKPVAAQTSTKFINPPPGIAPNYFQDRLIDTKQIVDFLKDDSQRLMTIIGRGGVGKTVMVCRLLKGLEGGELPDGLGNMKVEGIVYLSESGSHSVNFANIFYDLCKLLPSETAWKLDAVYKNPQASTESKMHLLLEAFGNSGHVVLLLDNFEPLVDLETSTILDAELEEALHAFLNGTHTTVKIIITARVSPRTLNLTQPGRQRVLSIDEGLASPYAENILREMDSDGRMGLSSASDDLLHRAREWTLGYPRALEALFAILASDRYTTLEELLDKPTPENVVQELVGEAFNRLDTNAQKVMQALAVYNRPVTPAAVDYLLAPHLPAMDSAPILQRLANMHFARKESGRFYLQRIDREYSFGLIPFTSTLSSPSLPMRNAQMRDFTQHDLTLRAADYFAKVRKPRAEWKKLGDFAAQLAEFDLRCSAGDYDTATSLLIEIDLDYLLSWGHYRLVIDLHGKLQGKIKDENLARISIGNLGRALYYTGSVKQAITNYEKALVMAKEVRNHQAEGTWLSNLGLAYASLGNMHKAIAYYEQALVITRDIGDRHGEGEVLGNLGSAYEELGNARKSIEYYEQALILDREVGDRYGESIDLEQTGVAWLSIGEYQKSIRNYQQAIQIADEILSQQTQNYARWGLSQAYLFQNDLVNARTTIEAALHYDVPQNNHNATALHGIIALRQENVNAASQAFARAIVQADEILAKTPEYYSALDAKGLALCGSALCAEDDGQLTMNRGKTIAEAVETFRKARKIAPHAGVVKSVLRLFDEIAKCDKQEILKDVRNAVEGKD